jgi:phosphohistidine phosphatase
MLVLLVRHAHAGDHDINRWPDDRERPLTDKGRKTHRRVSRMLGKLELIPTLVLTSPWTRAAQTAAILVETLELGTPPMPCDALATQPDLDRLTECAGDPGDNGIVAMVGHSPWMEELAALLLAGGSGGPSIDFPKSGVMGIDVEQLAPGAGVLRFFLRPGMAKM